MAENLGALVAKLQADVGDLKKGLRESRQELSSFKSMAQDAGAKVKQALTFVGVAVGIYEIASALKAFAVSAAMVGARAETVAVGMEHIGKAAGLSRGTLDYYVEQLKKLGITTKEAMEAVTRFTVSGLPLTQIEALADVARNQAALVGKNTSEAFNDILTGILTQQPEILRKYLLNIGLLSTVLKSAMKPGMTAEDIDPLTRSMMVLNATLETGKRSAGAYEASLTTVGKQLGSLPRFAEEAKAALWALFKPVMTAGVQEMTQGWKDLKEWADANQESLERWGQEGAAWLKWLATGIRDIGAFIAENKKLIKTLMEIYIAYKAAGWITNLGGSIKKTAVEVGILAALLGKLKALIGGPWRLVITVAIFGLAEGLKKLDQLSKGVARGSQLAGEAYNLMTPEQQRQVDALGPAEPRPFPGSAAEGHVGIESEAEKKARAEREAIAAHKKAQEDAAKLAGDKTKAGGKGGAGVEGLMDRLLSETLKMLKAKREAEIQEAENSLELLRATNEQKRAELAKSLAAELIDGENYYRTLQDLNQAETDASLALIEKKKQIQIQAHKEALANLADKTLPGFKDLSEEARAVAAQTLEAQHRKEMSKLATEAATAKLDGEVKVTNELRRQIEVQKQFKQQVEDLELIAAWGPIEEQEARLRHLYLEWQRAKADALAAGASPDLLNRMDAAYQHQAWAASPEADQARDLAQSITYAFSSAIDAMMSGAADLKKSLNSMFKGIFDAALKPGLKALEQLLMNGFKELFGAVGSAVGSAMMGVIGLVGMLLTSGGGGKSWSPSGIQGGVTGHEAVRGVIAGEVSIPIAQIGVSLMDALVPTNSILSQIEGNTRGGRGGSGGGGDTLNVNVTGPGFREALEEFLGQYFSKTLIQGA